MLSRHSGGHSCVLLGCELTSHLHASLADELTQDRPTQLSNLVVHTATQQHHLTLLEPCKKRRKIFSTAIPLTHPPDPCSTSIYPPTWLVQLVLCLCPGCKYHNSEQLSTALPPT
eukprot:139833-Pelagomonas_calceolata.AAC.2